MRYRIVKDLHSYHIERKKWFRWKRTFQWEVDPNSGLPYKVNSYRSFYEVKEALLKMGVKHYSLIEVKYYSGRD